MAAGGELPNGFGVLKAQIARLEDAKTTLDPPVDTSPYQGRLSCEFDVEREGFVQMGAVIGDHGVWDEPGDYFGSHDYASFGGIQMAGFRSLVGLINHKVERLRRT